jgi:hypothetical protein
VNLVQTKIWRIQYKYFHSENQHGIALFFVYRKEKPRPKVCAARPKMYSLWQKDAPSYAYNSEVNSPSFKSEKKETTDQSRSRNSLRKKKEKKII